MTTTTEITPKSFESRRSIDHFYTFERGVAILVSPFGEGDVEVVELIINACRVLVDTKDPELDVDYVDITVKGRAYKTNKNGRKAALAHHIYISHHEIQANPWVAKLVEQAREEAQQS